MKDLNEILRRMGEGDGRMIGEEKAEKLSKKLWEGGARRGPAAWGWRSVARDDTGVH